MEPQPSAYPITILIVVLNIIASFIAFNNRDFMNKAIMWPYGVKRHKQYFRFISSGFVHADYMHLIFNMFTFFFFGRNLELLLKDYGLGGNLSYIALYFLALIVSGLPTYFKQQDNERYLSLGASGAVSAVVFGAIVFSPWSSIYLFGALKISALVYAILYVVYCLYAGKKGRDHINHSAHLWGSLFGLAFVLILIFTMQPWLFNDLLEQLKHPSLFGN